ncbi:MAG: sensor domain-containing diguanylate cyclase [Pseudomonadales bacterium]|nr:sensor domain-containing diguanylate cyclase [Pseudomonadales bacterium]
MRLLLGILSLLLLSLPVQANEELVLTPQGEYVYDTNHELSIDDILRRQDLHWIQIQKEFSLGLIYDTVWVRLPIPKDQSLPRDEGILYLSNHLINDAWVYLVDGSQLLSGVHLGDHVQMSKKQIKLSDIYWQLPKEWTQASHLIVRIRSDSFFHSEFVIKSVPKAMTDLSGRFWLLGMFYGAISIMFIYNLFVYLQVRDERYLYYTGYVCCVGFFHAAMDGLPYYYLSDIYELQVDRISVHFVVLANIFGILFVTKFLAVRDKLLLRALRTLIYTFIVAFVIETIEQGHISTIYAMVLTVVTALSITYITIHSWLAGNRQARYLALAWIVLVISTPIYSLALTGFIPQNIYTLNSVRIGVTLELALLSFSLAYRISVLRQERLDLQRRLNKELGSLVAERTAELETANAKLQELSETDSLTQLKNRAYFNETIEDEIARAARNGSELSLLLMDLDHFKKINDELGHNAGDYCLKEFANLFQEKLTRTTDVACRYGGEEFIALLPETELEGALQVAEKIRSSVEKNNLEFEGTKIALTVSIGVISAKANQKWRPVDWVDAADKALYFAKTERNKVAFSSQGNEPEFASL